MLEKITRSARVSAIFILLLIAAFGIIGHAVAAETGERAGGGTPAASQAQSTPPFILEHFYPGKDNALLEFGVARSDHAAIALNIGQCYRQKIGDPINWSPTVRAVMLFELDEHLMHTLPGSAGTVGGKPVASELPTLNAFHAAAIAFSDRISRDRLIFRKELEDNRQRSRMYQAMILALGACATIAVSARAMMQGNTRMTSIVGVLAVTLSAAGTAVSSMNSFEGSQGTVLRDQRALSQLQQLHWRIAADVLQRPRLCLNPAAPPDDEMKVVDAWRSRLETILDSAVESISKPGDLSGGNLASTPSSAKNDQLSAAAANH